VESKIHLDFLKLKKNRLLFIFRGAFIDEKRRLEARIVQLEEELEEEQTNTELTGDKHKKLAMTVEQLMLDLAAEKANNQKAEVNFKTMGRFH